MICTINVKYLLDVKTTKKFYYFYPFFFNMIFMRIIKIIIRLGWK